MVAVYLPKALPAFIYLEKSGIKTPKDLEGRTVGLVTGGTQSAMWLPFAKAAGFNASKVKVVQVDQGSYLQLLLQGKIHLGNGSVGSTTNLMLPVGEFALADYLPIVGHGIAFTKTRRKATLIWFAALFERLTGAGNIWWKGDKRRLSKPRG